MQRNMNPIGSRRRFCPHGHGIDTCKTVARAFNSAWILERQLGRLWSRFFHDIESTRSCSVTEVRRHLVRVLLHREDEDDEDGVEQEVGERHGVAQLLQLHGDPLFLHSTSDIRKTRECKIKGITERNFTCSRKDVALTRLASFSRGLRYRSMSPLKKSVSALGSGRMEPSPEHGNSCKMSGHDAIDSARLFRPQVWKLRDQSGQISETKDQGVLTQNRVFNPELFHVFRLFLLLFRFLLLNFRVQFFLELEEVVLRSHGVIELEHFFWDGTQKWNR